MVSRKKKFWLWWFRSGIGLRLGLFGFFSIVLYLLVVQDKPFFESGYLSGNVAVFSLVNLNIAILCILVFLVGRNLVKLLFDRKRNILGTQLRFRLVAAFMGLTAIPAVLLVVVASGLLSRALDGWFSSPAETSVEAAKDIGRIHFSLLRTQTLQSAKRVSEELQSQQLTLTKIEDLKGYLEKRRVDEGLFAIELLDEEFTSLLSVTNAAASIGYFSIPKPEPEDMRSIVSGESLIRIRETSSSQFIRSFTSLALQGKTVVLVVTYRVDAEMSHALATIREAYQEYLQLQRFQNPLRSTYILTLYMIAALVLFAGMWFGIYIAKQLTGPIQQLAQAMREVAKGNYGVQIQHAGDDEIGFLTKTYNQMTEELRESVNQAERRRIYLETVLTNLGVGVVVIDADRMIIGVNTSAVEILGHEVDAITFEGKPLMECIPAVLQSDIRLLLERQGEQQFDPIISGRERKLLCTAGELKTREGEALGSVLLLDDITALSEAQRMAAWREAARRIAHEIKNPLTPIKLAAQRLKRAFQNDPKTGQFVEEASGTIVEHVDSIKRLADEFSRFARMPAAEFQSIHLNQLINEIVLSYAEHQAEILFQCVTDDQLPTISADSEQIRRLLINLIENSVRALRKDESSQTEQPKVVVKTRYDSVREMVILEVSDNGPGIPKEHRSRVFEPYFSRSEGGTGLGLAIVAAIVSEHRGTITVDDTVTVGTKLVVSFPIQVQEGTHRKFDIASG